MAVLADETPPPFLTHAERAVPVAACQLPLWPQSAVQHDQVPHRRLLPVNGQCRYAVARPSYGVCRYWLSKEVHIRTLEYNSPVTDVHLLTDKVDVVQPHNMCIRSFFIMVAEEERLFYLAEVEGCIEHSQACRDARPLRRRRKDPDSPRVCPAPCKNDHVPCEMVTANYLSIVFNALD